VKVSVDNDRCTGHARCNHVAPEVFTLDEVGYSNIGTGRPVPAGQEELARQAVLSCPERALTIDEE